MTDHLKIHPAADIFPMMTDDELAELAADIKANGLIHPIILDPTGEWLIDGRNRIKACALADVKPRFDRLNGQDPRDYIISANINRRNMTAPQRAMAHALIYPKPQRGKRTDLEQNVLSQAPKLRTTTLAHAREIVPYRDLAERVLAGTMKFDAALTEARGRTEAKTNEPQLLAELQSEAPDLAEQVNEERLTFSEAWAAYKQRLSDAAVAEKNKRDTLLRMAELLYRGGTAFAVQTFVQSILERLDDSEFRDQLRERIRAEETDPEEIIRGAHSLAEIIRGLNNA